MEDLLEFVVTPGFEQYSQGIRSHGVSGGLSRVNLFHEHV